MERWSVMTADGLTLWREDIFTEDEAKAYVQARPDAESGSLLIAAPESVIRMAAVERKRLGEVAERQLQIDRVNATKRILHNHNVLSRPSFVDSNCNRLGCAHNGSCGYGAP